MPRAAIFKIGHETLKRNVGPFPKLSPHHRGREDTIRQSARYKWQLHSSTTKAYVQCHQGIMTRQ